MIRYEYLVQSSPVPDHVSIWNAPYVYFVTIIRGVVTDIFRTVIDLFLKPLLSSDQYLRGFIFGLAVAFIVGFVGRIVLYDRGRITHYFNPSEPPKKPTLSGCAHLQGCIISIIRLAILLAGSLLLLSGLLRACAAM